MSRRRKTGCFTRIIKIIASVTALLAWGSRLMISADAAVGNEKLQIVRQFVEETSNSLPYLGDDAEVTVETETFSLQKNNVDSNCDASYIIVSTIDGRVSALDLQRKGSLAWSVQADARPLYSSSLANMEIIRNGKKLRLIPSLDGALYQFDGEKVEAIPLSAETLLSTTYRLGDDSMIVGSKDLRNFGVNLRTGEVQFMCGSEGCSNYQGKMGNEPLDGSRTIVLTRSTQVVRSVDIKNGIEKWNFSVGQHQVSLPSSARPSEIDDSNDDNNKDDKDEYSIPAFSSFSADECSEEESYPDDGSYGNYLQLIVPEGRVVALNNEDFSQVIWEHKFDSPIAKAWVLRHGKLEQMSLFDGRNIPTLRTFTPEDSDNRSMLQPLLYIGSHQKLLYIQASPQLESILKKYTKQRIGHFIEPNVKVSWRPYPNTASTPAPIFSGSRHQISQNQNSAGQKKDGETTSLAVWHEDYPFDTGYFLYPEIKDNRPELSENTMLLEDHHYQNAVQETWLPIYLGQYWKEVIFISLAISFCVHFVLKHFFNFSRSISTKSADISISDTSKNSNSSHGMMMTPDNNIPAKDKTTSGEYISRFATDFDCLHCLGKGGFGVVFEAVNKVDDQHYAVKRTMLPKSEGAKEKVLREVRALAKLEHMGIVRYFNAWVESPPTGWQEERDKLFHFSDISGPTSCSNAASFTEHQPSYLEQLTPDNKRKDDKIKRNNMNDRNNCQNLILENKSDSLLETDSVLFSQEAASKNHQLKQSGSEEFSVQSNFIEFSDKSEDDFMQVERDLFHCGPKDLTESLGLGSDSSRSESRSSIPFSNYTSNSSAVMSHRADHSHQELSGDSVVFESSSNEPCHKEKAFREIRSSVDDSIVFEKSSNSEDNKEIKRQLAQDVHQNKQDHHTIDISLTSSNSEDSKPVSQAAVSGTRFFLYIQMQLYSKETLKDWLNNNTLNRDRHTVLDIFDQIVSAVDYVHSQGLMHRDLKPSNIFFTVDGVVKVGDFGLVTALCVQQDQETEIDDTSFSRHTAEVGTTLYMSPEQIARKPYDQKIDIFSLGLIFLELWIPFSTQMERIRTLLDAKRHILPARFRRELASESELVDRMTSSDPVLRPSTKEILNHVLFEEFAPTRMGQRQHKRTISGSSAS